MKDNPVSYGRIQSVEDLGRLIRSLRKQKRLTIETVSGLGNLSPRFLSELERGKETAEIGKALKVLRTLGLEVVIRPRETRNPTNTVPPEDL